MRDDQRFSSKKQEELTETFNRERGIRGTCQEIPQERRAHKVCKMWRGKGPGSQAILYGNWFCPKTATQSEEEWRTEMAEKRKKKTRKPKKKIII